MMLSNLKNVIAGLEAGGFIRSTTILHPTASGFAFHLTKDEFDDILYDLEDEYNLYIFEPRSEGDHYIIEIGG